MCERLIRTVKEECVWQHRFRDLEDAKSVIRAWIEWYNTKRPHSALDYQTPSDYASKCRGSTSVAA
jgi:putative transposase